jgi:probable O-glycosylation ligase (exosortase A-associated)
LRDYAIFLIILGPIPFYFLSPVFGILAFHFVGFLNPHRFTWGAAYNFPFAYVIASVTLLGIFSGRGERNKLPNERETWLFLTIWIIFIISTLTSINSNVSLVELERISKIFLIILLTLLFFCKDDKIRYLFWVIALSIGILGIKGGIFGILTGGNFNIMGPADSFIADNNDFGMALNIALPIIFGLSTTENNRKIRISLKILFFLCVISCIFTFSRGAIITLVLLFFVMWFMFRNKILNIIVFLAVVTIASYYVSEKWINRVDSISEYSTDSSLLGRVNSWHSAFNMAVDRPIIGGGLGTTNDKQIFQKYAPDPMNFHASHSIYFQMLGENGFVGFIIFISLFAGLLITLHRVKKKMNSYRTSNKLIEYASAVELSLMAFLINGITLGRAYFDLAYLVLAMGIIIKHLMKKEIDILKRAASEGNKLISSGTKN